MPTLRVFETYDLVLVALVVVELVTIIPKAELGWINRGSVEVAHFSSFEPPQVAPVEVINPLVD